MERTVDFRYCDEMKAMKLMLLCAWLGLFSVTGANNIPVEKRGQQYAGAPSLNAWGGGEQSYGPPDNHEPSPNTPKTTTCDETTQLVCSTVFNLGESSHLII